MSERPIPLAFNPNPDVAEGVRSGLTLPSAPIEGQEPLTATEYVSIFERQFQEVAPFGLPVFQEIAKTRSDRATAIAKAVPTRMPPTAATSQVISFMPDPQNNGVIEWPGIAPQQIKKLLRDTVAPQLIIGMRCADVNRYSDLSTHMWKPGWRIELMDGKAAPNEAQLTEIREAENFLQNSCIDLRYDKATERDDKQFSSFANFLEMATRDTLSYAAISLWKDVSKDGKVKAYALLPAGDIRLTGRITNSGQFVVGGYKDNPDVYAVLVNEARVVVQQFDREELTFYVRNPRTDTDIFGYGYPEVEMAIRAIQGYQNALDMNLDTFTRSAIPNGILVLSGAQVNQKQLDLLSRIWTNLKKGVTKSWALPVLGLNTGSTVTVLDLSRMKGNEAYYENFINMLAGILCVLWRFPVKRLGYHVSGSLRDTEPRADSSTDMTDADDPGLAPLLSHLAGFVNQYILWTRWPDLRFTFTGANPKEDARQYEARRLAMTLREARGEADLRPLQELFKKGGPEQLFAAELMDMAPLDPGLAGVFQSIVAQLIQAKFGKSDKDAATPGARMTAKVDPAKAETHGHTSGVRRRSKIETKPKTSK